MTTTMNHSPRNLSRPHADISRESVDAAEALDFEDAPAPAKRIELHAAIVNYRGRQLVITSEGYTADELCDLLDKRFGTASQVTQSPASAPICPIHSKPMKPMQHADKQGRQFWCTQKHGDGYCSERA